MKYPLISVIIPTHNEEKVIATNLRSLKKSDYPNIETIVVDDGSSDNTPDIAKKLATKVFVRPHLERSIQRNFGANQAKGKYLLFLDADMEITRGVLTECIDLVKHNPRIGAVAIPELPIATNFLERVKSFERSFYSDFGDPDTDAARFFPKDLFNKVGGYDATITGPEDWDLPERIIDLGYSLGRITSRIKHFERVPSLFKLLKKKYYYGLSSHRYFKKHNISIIGPKTIYILRPIFYRNWTRLVTHPILSLSMFFVLTLEQIFGGVGFLVGRFTNK